MDLARPHALHGSRRRVDGFRAVHAEGQLWGHQVSACIISRGLDGHFGYFCKLMSMTHRI